jgi:hypothetical protein
MKRNQNHQIRAPIRLIACSESFAQTDCRSLCSSPPFIEMIRTNFVVNHRGGTDQKINNETATGVKMFAKKTFEETSSAENSTKAIISRNGMVRKVTQLVPCNFHISNKCGLN